MKKRYIITGGPGSGKSTVLEELKKQGFNCFEEYSRQVIKEQLEKNKDVLPWKDVEAFNQATYRGRVEQYLSAKEGINFYDRGIFDCIAYHYNAGIDAPENLLRDAEKYVYEKIVFLAPPWNEIFQTDKERRETFGESKNISQHLKRVYAGLGYEVIALPKKSVEERVRFILLTINKQ